jgi:hypothetical protein
MHLTVFVFIVLAADFVLGNILQHFYFKIKSGHQYRTTYSIEKTNANIIIFGSSRAVNHYNPFIFETRNNLSYHNAGRNGENSIFYHYAVLQAILKRYTPKIILLDVMPKELEKTSESYDKLASLSPYYNTHPEMRSILELRSSHEKQKMFSRIYPFNSTITNIISGNFNPDKEKYIKGYFAIPSSFAITKPIETVDNSKMYELDSSKLKILRLFIKDCKGLGIKLYLVCSPIYTKFIGADYSIETVKKLAADNNVGFFDFSQDNLFLNSPKLFYNSLHLTDSGARIFSNMLIDRMPPKEN